MTESLRPAAARRGLTDTALKGIAVVSMVLDHIYYFFGYTGCIPTWCSMVGRLAAQAGLRVFHEAFADRAYNADGTLVSRRLPDAVIADPAEVAARVLRMVREHEVVAIDGTVVPLNADSVCVHGDSPSAVAMARAVRARLESEGVAIRAFAGDAAASAARD